MALTCFSGIITLSLHLILLTSHCDGGNILVFPVDGSHWINMKILLEELHSRGHNISVIRSSTSWYIPEKSPLYTSITIEMDEALENFFDIYLQEHMRVCVYREGASLLTFLKLTKDFLSMITQAHLLWCDATIQIFQNPTLVKNLKDSQYDLVLADPAMGPGPVLAKYLKLPLVLNVRWITSGEGHFILAPSPLSYIPVPGSGFTDKMDFIQRVKNFFFYSGCDIVSLLQGADIWLFRSDFVFEFPRPTMPNVVYIGGFQCKPAQPLPADLEEFVQSAGEHGVIIMTLGTLVNALPKEVSDEIASVFAKMPQKVIWRHKGEHPSTLGNNTLLVDWMPQKDLLGHPQIKVFVAHGGTNGVQEAIYFGVPVLGIPLFFDQYDNLLRLQKRGAAKIIQLADVNGHTFEKTIKELLHKVSYRENMQRLSSLHRDQQMPPMDQATFWVEYVMRHKGAPHLRTEAYRMPWYSYYCLDVLIFLVTTVTLPLFSIFAIAKFLCCTKKRTKTKQN
uniref:UDP-glucuronosyltransferase n=1 Tax=Xiphophorus couchianus TaxID=32473 RepID=A0A3B5M709_9TELE